MALNAKCPTIGKYFIWFAPGGATAVTNDAASVQAAFDTFMTDSMTPPVEGAEPKKKDAHP
jgi:hypothetical protein